MSTALDIRNAAEQLLLSLPGVYGVGIGKNSPESINVYLKSACPKITCNIPEEIGGVPVKQIVTGKITALGVREQEVQASINRAARARPYYAGMSISTERTSAGTLGVKCFDAVTREALILTNNHIGANETSIQVQTASVGDAILQPGKYDGGTIEDRIATLFRFIGFDIDGENEVDGAVLRPDNPEEFADEILEIGKVTEIREAKIGDVVRKSGRSTGFTESTVIDTNATIKVDYESSKGITFKNQIIIMPAIGQSGDSGSLIVRKSDDTAVGLLIAGSENITVANRMTIVAEALKIDLGTPAPKPSQEPEGKFWGTVAALGILPLAFIMKRKHRRD